MSHHTPMLLEVVREHIRATHYSRRTEQSYTGWMHWYVMFHGNRHPSDIEGPEVEAFLTDLAVNGKVSAATQTQALAAFLFLCREVLGTDLPWLDLLVRTKPCRRLRLSGELLTFVSGHCGGHQGPVMAGYGTRASSPRSGRYQANALPDASSTLRNIMVPRGRHSAMSWFRRGLQSVLVDAMTVTARQRHTSSAAAGYDSQDRPTWLY